MCAEMDECIGFEPLLEPQILGYVWIGRCCFCAMHHLEGVAARSCRHLRHEDDIAQLDDGQTERLCILCQIVAGVVAIDLLHVLLHLLCEECLGPCVKITFTDQHRFTFVKEFGLRSFGIGAKHAARLLDKC